MQLEYKNFQAKIIYCGQTKLYYGEILYEDDCVTFQATNRHAAVIAMERAIDLFLQPGEGFVER